MSIHTQFHGKEIMIGWGRAGNEILERDFPFSGIKNNSEIYSWLSQKPAHC